MTKYGIKERGALNVRVCAVKSFQKDPYVKDKGRAQKRFIHSGS